MLRDTMPEDAEKRCEYEINLPCLHFLVRFAVIVAN